MTLHHSTPFAICVGEPNPGQQQNNVACLPLVMKDDHLHHHSHHHHLHDFDRLPKIPIATNGKSAWTDTATECLIDVFEEKWNNLRRGNLKARNWDEVGAELGIRCGVPKTGDQCRHKVEKLRGRFRQEKVISNFGQSKWPWYDRLNLVFGDRAARHLQQQQQQQLKDGELEGGGGVNVHACEKNAGESFQHDEPPNHLQIQPLHQAVDLRIQEHSMQNGGGDEKNNHGNNMNEKGENEDSYTSGKRMNSGEEREESTPRSRSGRGKRRRECAELGAAMKYLGETLMKIEECKMEVQRDNERLRIDLETKRAQMQDIELKRTEMLIQMELKRTEMLCDLELRRTKMQMDLFEALASKQNARSKKS